MTDKVQLIKQEIERRIENLKFSIENNAFTKELKLDLEGNITTLNSLLQFIGSLPEKPAKEDLENAAIAYSCANPSERSDGMYDQTDIEWAFEAGAEWQKQKDQETIELAEDHAMLAGMNKMKEEMMENAVDGYVSLCHDYPHRRSLVAVEDSLVNFEYAEKVKIIICKTEQ